MGEGEHGDWGRSIPGVRKIEPHEINHFSLLRSPE
jgi:hypothetical protein